MDVDAPSRPAMSSLRARLTCGLRVVLRATVAGDDLERDTHGARRTAQAALDLPSIHVELGQRAVERIAVHPELFGCLALIAVMTRKHFRYVRFLEFPDGVRVSDAGRVHLNDEVV
jgi:hypothetical protein